MTEQEQEVTCQICQAVFATGTISDEVRTTQAHSKITPSISSKTTRRTPVVSLSILDRFMALLFRFGKTFASLLAVLCLLSVFGSIAVFALNLRTKMEIPTYAEIAAAANEDDQNTPTSTTALDERRAIEKRFGDRVVAIIKEHKFDQDDYDQFIRIIQSIEPENRARYLSGLEGALKSRDAAIRDNNGNALSVHAVAGLYTTFFSSAEAEHESAKEEARSARFSALAAVFISCFMLFMMLIVPALLRIEENTRRPA